MYHGGYVLWHLCVVDGRASGGHMLMPTAPRMKVVTMEGGCCTRVNSVVALAVALMCRWQYPPTEGTYKRAVATDGDSYTTQWLPSWVEATIASRGGKRLGFFLKKDIFALQK